MTSEEIAEIQRGTRIFPICGVPEDEDEDVEDEDEEDEEVEEEELAGQAYLVWMTKV